MQFYAVLVLFVTLSTVCGLQCHECTATKPSACTGTTFCPDQCSSLDLVDGSVTRGCGTRAGCKHPLKCCGVDLCNSAIPTGSSVLLLLVSTASITLFL